MINTINNINNIDNNKHHDFNKQASPAYKLAKALSVVEITTPCARTSSTNACAADSKPPTGEHAVNMYNNFM